MVIIFQLKWLWKCLKGYRAIYVFALFSTAILAAWALVNPIIISRVIDDVIMQIGNTSVDVSYLMSQLTTLLISLVVLTLMRTLFGYLSLFTYEFTSQTVLYKLRNELYVNMQKQDSDFYNQNRTGDLMTRLSGDMDMIRHTLCWVVRMFIDCIVLFASTIIYMLNTNVLFTLSLLVATPFIFILTKMFSKRVRPLYADLREKLSVLNTAAQENISGNRVVKAFARENYECEKFDEKNLEFKKANLKASLLWLKFYPYVDGLCQALAVAVLLVGGIFVINGDISLGEFAAFNGLCWTLTNPMRMIGMLVNDLQRFFASATKVIELYYARSTITNRHNCISKDTNLKGNITFKDVTVRKNSTDILKNINLEIKCGETVAIMGETGSGKSSLISLLPRLSDVTSGEIIIDDVPIKQFDLKCLRKSIGMATQEVFLFSDSIDSNIAYGDSKMSELDVKRFAKIADVNFADKMPEGFDTIIGERGTGLSGGQKQRIALARAIAIRPSILILDDTTSAVDLETEKYIQEQLDNLDFECTKIIVAQRISTTKNADKIIVLSKGEIVECGTHDELIRSNGYYSEVYALQNGISE